MRFAPEGYPYFAVFMALTGIVYLLGGRWIAIIPALLTLFMFWFFRDPERTAPKKEGVYVSTADGKVIVAGPSHEKEYLDSDAMQVSIFMSPVDVHVNRAPCDGVVRLVKYNRGSFRKAFTEEAFRKNENIAIVLEEEPGRKLLMRQVAGTIAQKAVCRVKEGERLERGQRFGIIKFSSRMDIFLPTDVELAIRPGDRVKAGESIIARRRAG
jgi:phosphatidylserine decarboxylase